MDALSCHHCGEPAHRAFRTRLDGVERDYCCAGCAAAASFIAGAGLSAYYTVREATPLPVSRSAAQEDWDGDAVAPWILREGTLARVDLVLEGLRCGACAWLIARVLGELPGVVEADASPATGRATLRFDPAVVKLSVLVERLSALGYRAQLPHRTGARDAATRRTQLKRLAVAGLGAMQSMMFAEALYFGEGDLDVATRDLFRWVGWLVATPVVFYAGAPLLRGAWRELRARAPGMDLMVGLSVLIAYAASLVETLRGGPVVYFDAAVMFVFLVLATRGIEQAARARAAARIEALARRQPAHAHRIEDGVETDVPVHALRAGDVVRVRVGEAVPADGLLLDARASFGEDLLTGESEPVLRTAGERVLAGSLATEVPARIEVRAVGASTTLASLARLAGEAGARKPRLARRADRWARHFVWAMLALAGLAAWGWAQIEPSRALPVALAVLAIACPCALSLAVPTAIAAAAARMAGAGLLLRNPDVLESLARADLVVLDKTGTVTEAVPAIHVLETRGLTESEAIDRAASLEQGVHHPIAQSLRRLAPNASAAVGIEVQAGAGIRGCVAGVGMRLGTPVFACGAREDRAELWLAEDDGTLRARFALAERARAGSATLIPALAARGLEVQLVSGDAADSVVAWGRRLGLAPSRCTARATPAEKLAHVRAAQARGHAVLMIGDGVNDAAVLAGADASIACAEGAAAAQANADAVLVAASLEAIPAAIDHARRYRRIVHQNLGWALGYNALAIPVALLGGAPPWLAAAGMSASSLLVTLNALRLLRVDAPRRVVDSVTVARA